MNLNQILTNKQLLFVTIIIFPFIQIFPQKIPAVQNKDTVVVLSKFGVKGDGKTDDTNALQRAVTYCENNSIKALYIPNGNYLIKKSIVFNKGGLQIIGTGALLREESWLHLQKQFSDNAPFSGCSFIIEKNIEGFVFSKSVADPVRIRDIQFVAKEGRKVGSTTAISFKSEFWGPTWPFIIERCHFRGFNYAVKFQSPNQYCVAFVQVNNCAFSQNDECIYFSDIPTIKGTPTVGYRNLCWGFTFNQNKCHDNSRVIRGTFAKDLISITNNNMEGNIPYANGNVPSFIVDIELSHATINFEGNHFESIVSDAVYVSSVFKGLDGNYLTMSGTTALDEKNKIFIKGNNFDGINSKYKPFTLKGLLVYNYDPYNLYIDASDIRENNSNSLNLYLTDYAAKNGTNIKTEVGKYENSHLSNTDYLQKLSVTIVSKNNSPKILLSPISNLPFLVADNSVEQFLTTYKDNLQVSSNTGFMGASFIVNNQSVSGFLGISVAFYLDYTVNGKSAKKVLYTMGNYGTNIGFTTITGLLPVSLLPRNAKNIKFKAVLDVSNNILAGSNLYIANRFTLFTVKGNNPYAIPVFQ